MNRRTAAVLAALMLLSEPMFVSVPVYAQTAVRQENAADTISISTAEEFAEFAKNCTLDSYSVGKVFVLKSDINLMGTGIKPVPSFGGTFDGNGHTISGLSVSEDISVAGLIRYIEKSGTVKNLNVSGRLTPSGTAEKCGGVAGVNRGRIVNCSFTGVILGNERCGGIAGVNESEGTISGCSSSGRIQAEHFAGGIVGENRGYIRTSENGCSVNTLADDESLELSDLSVNDLYSTESFSDVTDAGGIAGYSDGSVQNCKNLGAIGYPHVGYNIGGIVGRQEGYISGCENYGTVNGRKDIGGIVGQAGPHLMISYSQSRADELSDSLDELNSLIDKTIDDMESRGDVISGNFSGINSSLDNIRGKSDAMMTEAERIINADVDSVNELSSRVSDLIDMLSPVADSVSDSADMLADGFDELSQAGELLAESLGELDEGTAIIFDSLDDISGMITELQRASEAVGSALESLRNGLGDPRKMEEAINALEDDISALKFAVDSISKNTAELLSSLDGFINSAETEAAADKIKDALEALSSASTRLSDDLDRLSEALKNISDRLSDITEIPDDPDSVGDIFGDDYQKYLDEIKEMLKDGTLKEAVEATTAVFNDLSDMAKAMSELSEGVSDMINSRAIERFKRQISSISRDIMDDVEYIDRITGSGATFPDTDIDELYAVIDYLKSASDSMTSSGDYAKRAVDMVKSAWEDLDDAAADAVAAAYCASDASVSMRDASNRLGDAVDEVGDIIDFFADKPDIVFVGADDGFIESRESLSASLESLTKELEQLNGSASVMGDIFAEDLRAINEQCRKIKEIIFEIIDEIRDTTIDAEEYTEDISESDQQGYADGKIHACLNYGEINGDLNVGGIVGTMGVDNSFDPESDTAEAIGERSLNFMYMLRTVVRDCSNYGTVIAKKNVVGGIVGEMSTGCVIGCGGFGDVSSASGGYVGGVAGNSLSKIVSSSAMCRLSGGDYVGGIAGRAEDMRGCRSFAEITESGEFTGAIAGQGNGELSSNAFVENGMGAVDGVSYRGKAFPVPYEKMLTLSDVPEEFSIMKLIFMADGEIVDTLEYSYGDSVRDTDIPDIPARSGSFAEWEEFDGEDLRFGKIINAVYSNLVTAIASEVCRDDGLPVFIVEGSYGSESLIAERRDAAWQVTVPDDGAESHLIRYYTEGENQDVYVNGERVDSERDGRYLVFRTNLLNFEVTTADKPFNFLPLIYAGSGVAVLAIIIIIAVTIRKRKKAVVKSGQ